MKLWVATSNKGKLDEVRHILGDCGMEIKSLAELGSYTSPPETASDFVGNARIKAKSLHAVKPEDWVIADDSGLEVDGLNKLPGVHSARYAGDKASDAANTAKLLKMMSLRSATNRQAQFVCVVVAINPEGQEFVFEGFLKGEISRQQRGTNGFGYDSVFIPEGFDKTLAEVNAAEKNRISHRAAALRDFRKNCL